MKRRKKAGRLMRRGAVLATATFLTMLLLVTGVGLLALGRTARIISIRTAADVGARGAADAGLTKAIWVMNKRLKSGMMGVCLWSIDRSCRTAMRLTAI